MRKTTLFQIIHNTTVRVTSTMTLKTLSTLVHHTPHHLVHILHVVSPLVHKACPWENPLETNISFYVHGQDAFVPVHKNANTLLSTLYHTP